MAPKIFFTEFLSIDSFTVVSILLHQWQPVFIWKSLHNSSYCPTESAKFTSWWFQQCIINKISALGLNVFSKQLSVSTLYSHYRGNCFRSDCVRSNCFRVTSSEEWLSRFHIVRSIKNNPVHYSNNLLRSAERPFGLSNIGPSLSINNPVNRTLNLWLPSSSVGPSASSFVSLSSRVVDYQLYSEPDAKIDAWGEAF